MQAHLPTCVSSPLRNCFVLYIRAAHAGRRMLINLSDAYGILLLISIIYQIEKVICFSYLVAKLRCVVPCRRHLVIQKWNLANYCDCGRLASVILELSGMSIRHKWKLSLSILHALHFNKLPPNHTRNIKIYLIVYVFL